MRPFEDVLPAKAKNLQGIIYDFKTTQIKTYSDTAKNHVPTSSACNSFVRDVINSKTVVSIVTDAAGEGTLFRMIL